MNKTKYELTKENVFLKIELNKTKIENRKLKAEIGELKNKKLFIPFLNLFRRTNNG